MPNRNNPHGPPPRRPRSDVVFEALGWTLAGAAAVVAAIAIVIDAHFKCGGTIGFMEAADLFRDEQCFTSRRWLGLIPLVLLGLAGGLRIDFVDRRNQRALGRRPRVRSPLSRRRAARGEGR